MHNEELAAVGIWPGIGHGYGSPSVFSGDGFVIKFVAGAAGAVSFGIAALDHKSLNYPMKDGISVEAVFCQSHKVINGDRSVFGVKRNFDFADRGLKDGDIGFVRVNLDWFHSLGGGFFQRRSDDYIRCRREGGIERGGTGKNRSGSRMWVAVGSLPDAETDNDSGDQYCCQDTGFHR